MSDRFDVRGNRHRMKLLRQGGDTELYENRKAVPCPACGDPFERLFLTRKRATTFPKNDGARFCLLRQGDELIVFRH